MLNWERLEVRLLNGEWLDICLLNWEPLAGQKVLDYLGPRLGFTSAPAKWKWWG